LTLAALRAKHETYDGSHTPIVRLIHVTAM
jgi:hypothetical protein